MWTAPARAVALALGVAAVLASLAGCVRHTGLQSERAYPVPREAYRARTGLVYTPPDWPEQLTADVYRPAARGRHPAVLVVHGGGWTRRSPEDMTAIAERLAAAGFVAVNVAYRFAPEHRFPAQVHDLQLALAWLREHAERFAVDPDRIAGLGYSAGAHLVALLALVDADDPLDHPWGGEHARLAAAVVGGTPSDLRRWPDSPLVNALLGRSLDDAPALWAAASPLTYVDGDDPPFFLYHGGLDRLVEPSQAEDLAAALRGAGVPAELFVVPYHGHVTLFAFDRQSIRESIRFLLETLGPATAGTVERSAVRPGTTP